MIEFARYSILRRDLFLKGNTSKLLQIKVLALRVSHVFTDGWVVISPTAKEAHRQFMHLEMRILERETGDRSGYRGLQICIDPRTQPFTMYVMGSARTEEKASN